MAGEMSRLNFEVAQRAAGLQSRALMQILDSFVEDPAGVADMATQIIEASDRGQLAPQIAQATFPAVQQIMKASQTAQAQRGVQV